MLCFRRGDFVLDFAGDFSLFRAKALVTFYKKQKLPLGIFPKGSFLLNRLILMKRKGFPAQAYECTKSPPISRGRFLFML